MKLTKSKLKEIIKEEIQLGKVYTFKDKPPFKTNEEQLTEATDEKWVVWIGQGSIRDRKLMKVAKSRRAALIYYNKLVNSDKYDELGMESVEHWNRTNSPKVQEGKITEAKASAEFYKGIQKWYGLASDLFPELEKTYKEAIKAKGIKNDKLFLEAFNDAVKYADLSFKKLDLIVKFMKKAGL